jgi:hypothetical protein
MTPAIHEGAPGSVEERRSIGARAGAIVLAVAFALIGVSSADAGCSPGDIWNALQSAANGLSSGCSTAAADPADYAALGALTGAAGIAQVAGAPQFCQGVQSAYTTLNNVQGDANSVLQKLKDLGIFQNLSPAAQQTVASALGTLGGANAALSTLSCACSVATDQGIGQVGNDISACIQSALCSLQNALPGFNQCTGSTNVTWVDCTQDPCAQKGPYDSCIGKQGYIPNAPNAGGASVQCKSGPTGQVCWSVLGADSNGNVSVAACLCPAGMTMNTSYNGGMTDSYGTPTPYLLCTCPSGTHPAGISGGLSRVCMCDNTNRPPLPLGGPAGICPPPLAGTPCPSGQVNVAGRCVTPCANPGQVPLSDGTCCSPSQASSCGICCPSGQIPDARTGSCKPAVSPAPNPARTLKSR